jgi:Flp pilus assembly protein TadD
MSPTTTRSRKRSSRRSSLSLLTPADVHHGLAEDHTLDGRTTEAVARLEEAVATEESTSSLDPYTLVSLGQAYLSPGRSEEASRRAGSP